MDNLISIIVISAALSLALNVTLKRWQVEPVIGYIITGMIVGYGFDLQHNASLELVAEFGIVFLMFTIGLEFSPKKLQLMKKEVFVYGPAQLLITAAVFFGLGHWVFGMAWPVNLIISLSLSLSSTAIVLNLLTKNRKIGQPHGRNSVGVLLFQDIAVIPILLMVSILASDQQSISALLLSTAIDAVIVFLILFLGGRFVTPYLMEYVVGTRSSELFVGVILLIVVGAAQLAHGLGFSYSLGAFLAGMVIAESHYKHQVEADLAPFRDLLLGLFFITVGMQVDPLFVVGYLPFILAVMLGLLVVKGLVLFGLMRLFNNARISMKTALLLAQSGEFSFVVFETAQANNLFTDPELGQSLIMAIVLTMMLTPFVFRYLDYIVDKLLPKSDADDAGLAEAELELEQGHMLVLGYGKLGERVGALLAQQGIPFSAIEYDASNYRMAHDRGEPVYFGNAARRQMLEQMHLSQARAVIVAMSNQARISLVVQSIQALAPSVQVLVCAADRNHALELKAIGIDDPVDILDKGAEALVERALSPR
ncbi:MAG: cation:proton antiporter [Halopseudomonas sp.]